MKTLILIMMAICFSYPLSAEEVINATTASKGNYSPMSQEFQFAPDLFNDCAAGFIANEYNNPSVVPVRKSNVELKPKGGNIKKYENDFGKLWFYYKIHSRSPYRISVTISKLGTPDNDTTKGYFNVCMNFHKSTAEPPFKRATTNDNMHPAKVILLEETAGKITDLIRYGSFVVGIEADFVPAGTTVTENPTAPVYNGAVTVLIEDLY